MKKRNSRSIALTVSLVIIAGFVISGVSTYYSYQKLFEKDVEAVSELTSENIFVNISNLMERPINVSIAMAHDTFLRDFMNMETSDGLRTDDLEMMQQYLLSYQQKYQFDSVFFVSAKTNNYYHFKKGIDRVLTPDNPENVWYYDFLNGSVDCSLNVDNDEAEDNLITVFVNCKLYDENQNILGVVGVGMTTPYIQTLLLDKEQGYDVRAYLIDKDGNIQVSSRLTEFEQVNLFEDPDFYDMAGAIDTSTTDMNQRWYHNNDKDGYVITRYIPDLNWYLVVEKNTQEFSRKMMNQLCLSFVFMLCVVFVVILITTKVIRRYDVKLKNLAELDLLTGIRNRTSYEWEMEKYRRGLETYRDFGLGICDLNNLKSINDVYGHQAGDECIKTVSNELCNAFEGCPVFRIGGDEFVVVFENLPEEIVLRQWNELSEKLSRPKERAGGVGVSVAFGYAFWTRDGLDTIDKIFKYADDNMYLNKKEGKRAAGNCGGTDA